MKYILYTGCILLITVIGTYGKEYCTDCHLPHYRNIAECINCHRGIPQTKRKDLAHYYLISGKYAEFLVPSSAKKTEGIKLIELSGCRRCHQIGGKGNILSVNLTSSLKNKEIKEIIEAIKNPNNYMPNFHFTDEQIVSIINGLLNFAYTSSNDAENFVQLVHIVNIKNNTFNKKCSNCHKLISATYGPLGRGNVAPNLSGLFSDFYPHKFEHKKWDKNTLEEWLKNPRSIKHRALMPVIELSENEFEEIEEIFSK